MSYRLLASLVCKGKLELDKFDIAGVVECQINVILFHKIFDVYMQYYFDGCVIMVH